MSKKEAKKGGKDRDDLIEKKKGTAKRKDKEKKGKERKRKERKRKERKKNGSFLSPKK